MHWRRRSRPELLRQRFCATRHSCFFAPAAYVLHCLTTTYYQRTAHSQISQTAKSQKPKQQSLSFDQSQKDKSPPASVSPLKGPPSTALPIKSTQWHGKACLPPLTSWHHRLTLQPRRSYLKRPNLVSGCKKWICLVYGVYSGDPDIL